MDTPPSQSSAPDSANQPQPQKCPACGYTSFMPYYPEGVLKAKHWMCRGCSWTTHHETPAPGAAALAKAGPVDDLATLKEHVKQAHGICDDFKIARKHPHEARDATLPERVNQFLEAARNFEQWMEQAERVLGHSLPMAPEQEAEYLAHIKLPHWIGESRLSLAEIGALACCACAATFAELPDGLAARMKSKDITNALVGLKAKGVLVDTPDGWKLQLQNARHPKDGGDGAAAVEPPPLPPC